MNKNSKHNVEFDKMVKIVMDLNYNTDNIDNIDLQNIAIGIEEAMHNNKILLAGKTLYCRKGYFRLFSKLLFTEYIKWISKYCEPC